VKVDDVERWMARVLDRIDHRLGIEDDRVELKREPKAEPIENARRIAGHANQVRSGEILWLFGIDEDGTRHPLPESLQDPNKWWSVIEKFFDDVAPSPCFSFTDGLLGIGFDTTRLPFVIKVGDNKVSREVPWRESTHIRSAQRLDVLKLLVPISDRPNVSLLDGWLQVDRIDGDPIEFEWTLGASLYVDTSQPLVFPDHRLRVSVQFAAGEESIALACTCNDLVRRAPIYPLAGQQRATPPPEYALARLAVRGDQQLVIHNSTPFRIRGSAITHMDGPPVTCGDHGRVTVVLGTAGLDPLSVEVEGIVSAAPLPKDESPLAYWRIDPAD
jgi:hypothetical protein